MLRIGLDFCALDPTYAGGVTSFSLDLAFGIVEARKTAPFASEIVIFVSRQNAALIRSKFDEFKEIRIVELPYRKGFWKPQRAITLLSWLLRIYSLRIYFDRITCAAANQIIEQEVDVLYCPTTVLNFYGLKTPSIVSMHDIQHEYMPENFSFLSLVRRWAPYRATCASAKAIQVSSDFIRRSIQEKYPFIPAGNLMLIPEGVSLQRFDPKGSAVCPNAAIHELGPFLFYPAQLWPHKNHMLLLEALALVRDKLGREMPCVLTGADKGMLGAITLRIEAAGLRHCFYLGQVAQRELLWLYQHCACVLALGMYESSCLPIKEAAAVGKPIIAADIEPNRELGGVLSLLLFKCDSADSLAQRVVEIATNAYPAHNEIQENSHHVRSYSWRKLAEQYLELFYRISRQEVSNDDLRKRNGLWI